MSATSLRRVPYGAYWLWLGPVVFVALVGVYSVARYGGHWAEADSATFASVIRPFAAQGALVPDKGPVYPNGFAFQGISTVLLALTGLDVATLQQFIYPLLASLAVLPAWLLYRELTGSGRGATLATALLFTQPEFLFVMLRSSHEKFTRSLMLIGLYLLARSFALRARPWPLAVHIVLFYLVSFALICSNNFLANSFFFAIGTALLLGGLLARRSRAPLNSDRAGLNRTIFVVFSSLMLVYIFIFYVYSPARYNLFVLKDTWQRIQLLFLPTKVDSVTGENPYVSAYNYLSFGWTSLYVYFLVSIANWIVLVIALGIWMRQGVRWLLRGVAPERHQTRLLWLLYAAFMAQGAISVVSDASGALGSNVQLRLFPAISIIGVGIVTDALVRWRPRRYAVALRLAFALTLSGVAVLSVLKATNEPTLSNKWTFYHADELQAMEWADARLDQDTLWTEFDERLAVAYTTVHGPSARQNTMRGYALSPFTRYVLATELTRLRSLRLGAALPVPNDALQIYDNGSDQIYRLRPHTPYER